MRQITLDNVNGMYWYDADGMTFNDFIPSLMTYMTRVQKSGRSSLKGTSAVFITNANLIPDFDEDTIVKSVKKFGKGKVFYMIFVRGTMTPSRLFTDENDKLFDKLKGIMHFAPDYSITTLNTVFGDTYNVLSIGGGITPERSWKMKHADRKSKAMKYLEDEMPILDNSIVADIIKSDFSIDAVVSNYAPSFICKAPEGAIEKWSAKDDKLESDYRDLFEHLDFLYKEICNKRNGIKTWIFPSSNRGITSLPSTTFISYDIKDDNHDIIDYISAKRCSKQRGPVHSSLFNLINEEKCIEEAQEVGDGINHGRAIRGGGIAAALNHPAAHGPRITYEPLRATMPWHTNDDPLYGDEEDVAEEIGEPEEAPSITVESNGASIFDNTATHATAATFAESTLGGDEIAQAEAPIPQAGYIDVSPLYDVHFDYTYHPLTNAGADISQYAVEESSTTQPTMSDRFRSLLDRMETAYTITHA